MDESQALVQSIVRTCQPQASIQNGIDRAEFLEFFSALTGAFVDTYTEIQEIKSSVSTPTVKTDTDGHYNRLSTQIAQSHSRFTELSNKVDAIDTKLTRLFTLVERLANQPAIGRGAPGGAIDVPKVVAKVEAVSSAPIVTFQQPPVFKKISIAIAGRGLEEWKKQEILKAIGSQVSVTFFEPSGIIMPDHKSYDYIFLVKNGLDSSWYGCAKRMIPMKKIREVMDVVLIANEIKKLIPSPSHNS